MAKNDLEYGLGLDFTALDKAGIRVAKFGDDTVRVLNKKFEGAALFRGLSQGLGIASVNQLADKLIAPFRESAESAERIAGWTEKAADATLRLIGLRQTDAQQLAALEKEYAKIEADSKNSVQRGFFSKAIGFLADPLNLTGGWASGLFDDSKDANAEKRAKAAYDLAKKAEEIERLRAAMKAKADAEEYRAAVANAKSEAERVESAKKLATFEREQRRAKLTDEQLIVDLAKEKREVDKTIAMYEKEVRDGMILTKDGNEYLLGLKQQQEALQERIAAATERQHKAEKAVGEQIVSNIAAWKEFTVLITSTGRGDSQLSDRELAKKIKNINQALFESQVNRIGRIGVGNERGEDPFGFINQNNLSQALAEQRLRATTRRNVAAFGEERAFAMFGGSEQSFARILRESQDNSEQTTILRNIEEGQQRGFDGLAANLKAVLSAGRG